MDSRLVFHATKGPESETRSHTLVFEKGAGNTLFVTYAKPRTGVDTFSRKEGNITATRRMDRFSTIMKTRIEAVKSNIASVDKIETISYNQLYTKATAHKWLRKTAYNIVSPTIIKSLKHFGQRALRYYGLESANLIIKGNDDGILKIRGFNKIETSKVEEGK